MRIFRFASRPVTALLVAVLAYLSPSTVRADSQPRVFDEAQVVAAILNTDPVLNKAKAQLQMADAQVDLATPRWSPGAYYTLEHFGAGSRRETEHELGASAILVAPGQHGAKFQAQVVKARQVFSAKRRVHRRVITGLRRFYRIVALQERIEILENWRRGLGDLHRVARARVEAGEAPGYEKLRIDLALRRARSEIRVTRAQREAESQAFSGYLGYDAKKIAFAGDLLPDACSVQTAMDIIQERASISSLRRAKRVAQDNQARMRRAWLPRLSMNAGLRMRRDVNHHDWGFGVGLSGAFPHPKRVRALRRVGEAGEKALHNEILAQRFDDQQTATHAGLLCLALLEERQRYVEEIQEVLEPLKTALLAEYREGQRDVIALMSVLERSMESQRYRWELAQMARAAELDFRDAKGVFER